MFVGAAWIEHHRLVCIYAPTVAAAPRDALPTGAGAPSDVRSADADPDGYVALTSTPRARIAIDGIDTGQSTPIAHLKVPPGRHKITFMIGGDRYTFRQIVRAGEIATVDKQLSLAEIGASRK